MRGSDAFETERLYKLRISDVDALLAAGALDDARVELLDGRLVAMSAQGGPHLWTTQRFAKLLARALGDEHEVVQHSSFEIGLYSMPEPDVAVVPQPDAYERPSRALLIIEVSESTLGRDRRKAALYAAAGAPEYWIANLRAGTVEVRTRPIGGRYRTLAVVGRTAQLEPVALPGVVIDLAEVLPPDLTSPARRARRR